MCASSLHISIMLIYLLVCLNRAIKMNCKRREKICYRDLHRFVVNSNVMKPFAPFCNVIIANAPFDSSLNKMHHLILVGGARLKADAPGGPVPALLACSFGFWTSVFPSHENQMVANVSGPAVVEASYVQLSWKPDFFFWERECRGRQLLRVFFFFWGTAATQLDTSQ
jgi:hypothetical protein